VNGVNAESSFLNFDGLSFPVTVVSAEQIGTQRRFLVNGTERLLNILTVPEPRTTKQVLGFTALLMIFILLGGKHRRNRRRDGF